MAKKTVIRKLINHYGLMSIDYQNGDEATIKAAQAVMDETNPEDYNDAPVVEATVVDENTGEVFEGINEDFPWKE